MKIIETTHSTEFLTESQSNNAESKILGGKMSKEWNAVSSALFSYEEGGEIRSAYVYKVYSKDSVFPFWIDVNGNSYEVHRWNRDGKIRFQVIKKLK